MNFEKRELNEEVPFEDICVAIKNDNIKGLPELRISFPTFTILQKINLQLGIVGQEPYEIYEDTDVKRYYYVKPDGTVFIPKVQDEFPASDHLASVTDIKAACDIFRKLISDVEGLELDEGNRKAISSFEKILNDIENAKKQDKIARIRLEELKEKSNTFIHLYIVAFGNPLEKGLEKEYAEGRIVRTMTEEEIAQRDAKENAAQEARSNFTVIEGNGGETPKGR